MRAKPDQTQPQQEPTAPKEARKKTEVSKEAFRAVAAHRALVMLLAGADDARALARLAIPMTETDFLNLCEERALAGKCGNPLCANQHAYKSPSHTPKINWSTLAMVTVTVEQHWCSKECHAKCAQFAKSLGNALDRLQVLNRLQAPAPLARKTPPVVSHVKGGQKAGSASKPPTILSDVHERVPGTAVSPAHAVAALSTCSGAQPCTTPAPPVTTTPTDPSTSPSELPSKSQPAAAGSEGGPTKADITGEEAALAAGAQDVAQGEARQESPEVNPAVNSAAGRKDTEGVARKKGGSGAFCKALMRDVKRSVQAQAKEAPVEADDFFDEQVSSDGADASTHAACSTEDEGRDVQGTAVRGTAAHSSQDRTPETVHLNRQQPCSAGAQVPASPECSGAEPPNTVRGDSGVVLCAEGGDASMVAVGGVCADVERYSAAHARPAESSTAHQKPYSTVKNKFKPVRCRQPDGSSEREVEAKDTSAPACSTVAATHGHVERSVAAVEAVTASNDVETGAGCGTMLPGADKAVPKAAAEVAVSPPKTFSGQGESQGEGRKSLPRPVSNGSKKKVGFGTCQMFAYDPDAPPADGGEGGMCEVPLPPASPQAQHQIVPSTLSSAAVLCLQRGSGTISHSDQAKPCVDSNSLPLKTGPARDISNDGAAAEATPVLCFNIQPGASENDMEGALRVTTAEELQLSEADLDAMYQALEVRPSTDVEQQREDAAAASGRPVQQRRPRLRRRGKSPAPPAAETQHDLQRQAVADMFRYYLAPEVGGAGVAVKSGQLHDVAATLKSRHRNVPAHAAPEPPHRSTAGESAAEQQGCQNDTCDRSSNSGSDRDSSDGAASQSDDEGGGVGGSCNSESEADSGSDAGANSDGGDSDVEGVEDDKDGTLHATQQPAARAGPQQDEADEESEEHPQSVEGFFDARAVSKPRPSLFGVAWKLLNRWVCPATVIHLHARPPPSPGFPQETLQAQSALRRMLMGRVEALMKQLHIQVARTVVEGALYDVMSTLDIRTAVPSMADALQDCIALVLLAALSKHCVVNLACSFNNDSPSLKGLLQELGVSIELFDCLLGCLLDPEGEA